MKIAFSEINDQQFNCEIADDGWFPHDEVVVEEPVSGFLGISLVDDVTAVVTGRMVGQAISNCNRCGKSVGIDLDGEFTYECIVGTEEPYTRHEVECREEDINKIYLEESVINIGDILREQVLLAIPISVLCHQSCKGLCSRCGANLNSGVCACDSERISSQFAKLKQLKGR